MSASTHECYEVFKSPIISDDSGLFVDALDGQPGVHSKRYAGLSSTDLENNQKLINELKTADNPSAFFKTVLCYFDGLNFIISSNKLVSAQVDKANSRNRLEPCISEIVDFEVGVIFLRIFL